MDLFKVGIGKEVGSRYTQSLWPCIRDAITTTVKPYLKKTMIQN